MTNVVPEVVSGIKVITELSLEGLGSKKTEDCFKGLRIRDSNFDEWFSETQPETIPCKVVLLDIDKVFELRQLIEILFGVEQGISIDGFAKHLEQKNHLLTLTQTESVIAKEETLEFNLCEYYSFSMGTGGHVYLTSVRRHGHAWIALPREIKFRSSLTPGSVILIRDFDQTRFMPV